MKIMLMRHVASSSLKARLAELDELVAEPKLYDDSRRAGKVVKERAQVEAKLETVDRLGAELQSWREMHGTRADPVWCYGVQLNLNGIY